MNTSAESAANFHPSSFWLSLTTYLSLAIISGFGLLGKLTILSRVVHLPVSVLVFIVLIWVCLPVFWKFALQWRKFFAPAVILGLLISSLVIFPRMAELQKTGRGTDQPDCVIVAAKGMATHSWPYDHTRMWSHTPMSCGPGWVAMQTPAIILWGYRWNLLILWTLALMMMRTKLSTNTIAGMLSLLGIAIVTWVTACNGTDFLPFGVVIAGLMIALTSLSRWDLVYLVILVFVAQFRFPMLIVPILLLPAWRLRQAIWVSVIGFGCQIAFLLWNPPMFVSDGPLHLFSKLIGERVLSGSQGITVLEVTLIFGGMLACAIVARKRFSTPWLALAYIYALAGGPAILDLHAKYRLYGSISSAFGIWEGVSWLGGCLPLAALYLLAGRREILFERTEPKLIGTIA